MGFNNTSDRLRTIDIQAQGVHSEGPKMLEGVVVWRIEGVDASEIEGESQISLCGRVFDVTYAERWSLELTLEGVDANAFSELLEHIDEMQTLKKVSEESIIMDLLGAAENRVSEIF